jgi:hypothetical protein
MKSKDLTPTQIAKQHNLNPSTVRNWVSLDAHNKVMRDNVGKPGLLDELAKAESIEVLKKKRKAQNLPNREDYREILSKKAVETNIRAGKNDLEVNISDSSFKKLKTELNVSVTKGQAKTQARVLAEADPRNPYSEACMIKAFQSGIDPALIGNGDATQYFSRFGNDCEQMLVHVKDESVTPITMTEKFSGDMGIFVKSYTMGTAAGHMAPMILVFSDPSMAENEMRVKKMVGVTHIPDGILVSLSLLKQEQLMIYFIDFGLMLFANTLLIFAKATNLMVCTHFSLQTVSHYKLKSLWNLNRFKA